MDGTACEGEYRGLGSRGVGGKAARVAVLERERKNQCGPSDIECKTTRVGASECGQRASFNGARGRRCHIDGRAEGRVSGSEEVTLFCRGAGLLAKTFGVGFIDLLDLLGRMFITHALLAVFSGT